MMIYQKTQTNEVLVVRLLVFIDCKGKRWLVEIL